MMEDVGLKFLCESELPENIPDDVYSAMFRCSIVDFVRLFPYFEIEGRKCFLVALEDK